MKQDEINKDLGSYLKERKDKPFWKTSTALKIKPKRDEEIDAAVTEEIKHDFEKVATEEEKELAPEDKKELETMESQIEEVEKVEQHVEEGIEEERENVLHKFFKKLNFSDKKKEQDEEQMHEGVEMSDNPEITMDDEELREVLHGLHDWIIQLPADKLEHFKNSKEFELYTKYLRKHNLIK
jgi:hypothetical protein